MLKRYIECDSNAVGIRRQSAKNGQTLAGHVPTKLSEPLATFIIASYENFVEVEAKSWPCSNRYMPSNKQVKSLWEDGRIDTH